MQTEPVRPPSLSFDADGVPSAPDYGDVYHARAGAWGQARHVFLGGNGLPERWGGREDFCILETGFGLGRNFLSTWQAWREDPHRPRRLHYLGIEKHPPTRDQLDAVRRRRLQQPADSPAGIDALEAQLHEAWPSLTPNLHALDFEGGRVRLLLAFFDVRAVLSELVAEVDAFYLDGFAPDRNPAMWDTHVIKAIGRLAAPGATAATWSVARGLRDALTTAGFQTEKAPGYGSKREMTVARHAPPPGWRGAPSRRSASAGRPACVAIVGAGLAGCTLAAALADLGIASTLFDRHSRPAQEASGQAAGLYHGVVTPQDGTHARFNRAAALQAARDYARWRTAGLFEAAGPEAASLIGSGLLRLEDEGALSSMQARLARLGLPDDHVRAVSADEAFDLTGLRPDGPGWWFAQGGAVRAGDVAEACRHLAGEALRWQGGVEVASLHRIAGDGAAGPAWALMDRHGKLLDQVDTVVLANAVDARRLLDDERARSGMATGDGYGWPLQRLRGQTSAVTLAAWQHAGLPCRVRRSPGTATCCRRATASCCSAPPPTWSATTTSTTNRVRPTTPATWSGCRVCSARFTAACPRSARPSWTRPCMAASAGA